MLQNIGIPFGIAGLGVGMGILGSKMAEAGMSGTSGLTLGGEAAVGFVAPAVNIIGGGMVIGLLKGFPGRRL